MIWQKLIWPSLKSVLPEDDMRLPVGCIYGHMQKGITSGVTPNRERKKCLWIYSCCSLWTNGTNLSVFLVYETYTTSVITHCYLKEKCMIVLFLCLFQSCVILSCDGHSDSLCVTFEVSVGKKTTIIIVIFPIFVFQFQSHQIFHVFVLAGAFVHYHGISEIANYRLTLGDCLESELA